MNDEEIYIRIEKYLRDELSPQEKLSFEKDLKNDVSLQEEFQLHQQIEETLKGEKIHQFRDVLSKVNKEYNTQESNKVFPIKYKRLIGLAASLLLLFLVIYPSISKKDSPSNEELFANNFEPYKMILNQRSVSENDEEVILLNDAITAYETKDYKTASTTFKSLQDVNPELIALRFYSGLSELGNGNSEAAIRIFKDIQQTPDHLFMEQNTWYLALSYLQKGSSSEAKKELENIQDGAFKHKEAKQILKTIK